MLTLYGAIRELNVYTDKYEKLDINTDFYEFPKFETRIYKQNTNIWHRTCAPAIIDSSSLQNFETNNLVNYWLNEDVKYNLDSDCSSCKNYYNIYINHFYG